MIRRLAIVSSWVAVSVLAPACSTIGDPGGVADGVPHGGTGQFRLLSVEETGVTGTAGRAIAVRDIVLENGMVVGEHLFYTAAPALAMDLRPPLPEDFPSNEVFWDAFEPRRIHRGARREMGTGAFDAGPEVLRAAEAWEGTAVFDPWVIEDASGTALLYYAAGGGIGVAEAPSLDGTFTRVGAAPILGPADALSGSPRRPSVVAGDEGGFFMYYDAGGEIRVARSEDGRTFTSLGPIEIAAFDDSEVTTTEVALANPGAVSFISPGGRYLVRVYVESVRNDGTHLAYVIGSADGISFERFRFPVMDATDVRAPAPIAIDERVTFLYTTSPFRGTALQTRAIVVSVSPAGESYLPELPE